MAADELIPPDGSASYKPEKKCQKCKNKVESWVLCRGCDNPFHASCLNIHSKRCNGNNAEVSEEVKSPTASGMPPQHVFLIEENKLLRKLISELESKNAILQENNSLLKEKILLFQSKQGAKPRLLLTTPAQNIEIPAQNRRTQPESKQSMVNISEMAGSTGSENLNLISKESRKNSVQKDIDKRNRSPERSLSNLSQADIYAGDKKNTNKYEDINANADDGFTKVVYKQRKDRKQPTIVGTATTSTDSFRGARRKLWFYVGKVDPDSTSDEIKTYIANKCQSALLSETDVEVTELKTKEVMGCGGSNGNAAVENPEEETAEGDDKTTEVDDGTTKNESESGSSSGSEDGDNNINEQETDVEGGDEEIIKDVDENDNNQGEVDKPGSDNTDEIVVEDDKHEIGTGGEDTTETEPGNIPPSEEEGKDVPKPEEESKPGEEGGSDSKKDSRPGSASDTSEQNEIGYDYQEEPGGLKRQDKPIIVYD